MQIRTDTIKVQLESYGPARDFFNNLEYLVVQAPGTSTDIGQALLEASPEAAELINTCRFVADNQILTDQACIKDGQTVGILPPFSGG